MQMDLAGLRGLGGVGLLERQGAREPGADGDGARAEVAAQRDPGLDRPGDDARRGAGLRRRPGRDTTAASAPGPPERARRTGSERRARWPHSTTSRVREGVDQETVGRGALGRRALQVRLLQRHRDRVRAEGAERGHRPADLGEERRAGVADRVAAEGLPALAADGPPAGLGDARPAGDRLPGPVLLRPAEEHGGAAEVARRGRPGAARDLREARHPAQGADDPRRRRGRRRRAGRGPQGGGRRGLRQRVASARPSRRSWPRPG